MHKKIIVMLLVLAGCQTDHFLNRDLYYHYGILSSSHGQVTLTEETLQIPIVPVSLKEHRQDPIYGFGYIILSKTGQPISHAATLTAPPDTSVDAPEAVQLESPDKKTRIIFPERMWLDGKAIMFIAVDKTDPEGEYSFDILLDGRISKTITFTLYHQH